MDNMTMYHCSFMRIVILQLNTMKVILACYISTVLLLQPGFGSSYFHSSCLCTGIYHHALSIWSTRPSQSLSLNLGLPSLTTLAASDSEEVPAHGEAANPLKQCPTVSLHSPLSAGNSTAGARCGKRFCVFTLPQPS